MKEICLCSVVESGGMCPVSLHGMQEGLNTGSDSRNPARPHNNTSTDFNEKQAGFYASEVADSGLRCPLLLELETKYEWWPIDRLHPSEHLSQVSFDDQYIFRAIISSQDTLSADSGASFHAPEPFQASKACLRGLSQ